jgi:uncharacterized membrane protein
MTMPAGTLARPVGAERALSASRWWFVAVWGGAAIFATLLSLEAIHDHSTYHTGFDTAVYDQLLWLLAHGQDPFSTVVSRPMLADHFQPGLVLLTPLYWLGLGVPGILAAQAIGLALTAPALYVLARSLGASAGVAAIPAFAWLVCPWVASFGLFEFRPTAFLPVLLALSVYAALARRDVLFWSSAILALSLKEDIPLTYLMLAGLLFYYGRRRTGTVLAVVSVAWFVVASWAIQVLSNSYDAFGQRFAGERGDSVGDALLWSLEHPLQTLSDVVSQSLLGVLAMFVSTAGLGLLAPAWLLLALPTIAYNALSDYSSQHDLVHHYHLGTLAGFFVAAGVGAARVGTLGRRGRLGLSVLIALGAVVAVFGGARVHGDSGEGVTLDESAAERALALIPSNAPAAAVLPLLPHLSQRQELYTLPEPFIQLPWGSSLTADELAARAKHVDYVAYIPGKQVGTFFTGELGRKTAVADVRPLLDREGFVVIARAGPLEILKRR